MEIVSKNAIKPGFFGPFGRNQRINALFSIRFKIVRFVPLCLFSFVPQCLMKRKIKNKANLPDAKMNVKSFQERDYDDFAALRQQKNKANFKIQRRIAWLTDSLITNHYSRATIGFMPLGLALNPPIPSLLLSSWPSVFL